MNLPSINKTITLLSRLVDLNNSTIPIVSFTPQKRSALTYDYCSSQNYFPRVSPESTGISSEHILSFLKTIKHDKTLNMHNILIIKNGKVICETGFGEYDPKIPENIFSASKSVTSLAIGMLVDEKKLALDDKLINIFSAECNPLTKLKFKDITLRDILTMTSGILFSEAESMTEEDWFKGILGCSMKGEVGKSFHYNSLNTYLLSVIVKKITGETLGEYLKPRLFEPLGIKNYFWEKCPMGLEKGGWGLYICLEDLGKIAQTVLDGGVFNGKRIVSEEYLKEATSKAVVTPDDCGDFNYGYQYWVGRETESFMLNGMFGQNAICFKNNGTIILNNAGNNEIFQQSTYYKYVIDYFSTDFPDQVPENPTANSELIKYINELECKKIMAPKLETEPEKQKKSAFFDSVRNLFYEFTKKNIKKSEANNEKLTVGTNGSAEVGNLPQIIRRFPTEAENLINKKYHTNSLGTASVGIFPLLLQAVQNNYTSGLKDISFEKDENGYFCLIYSEKAETHNIKIGFENDLFEAPESQNGVLSNPERTGVRGEIFVNGEPYLISACGRWAKNEDMNNVLIITVNFLEMPSTRKLKFFFSDDYRDMTLFQSEVPGEHFATENITKMLGDFSEKPFVSSIMDKFGTEYFTFKLERLLTPKIEFTQE